MAMADGFGFEEKIPDMSATLCGSYGRYNHEFLLFGTTKKLDDNDEFDQREQFQAPKAIEGEENTKPVLSEVGGKFDKDADNNINLNCQSSKYDEKLSIPSGDDFLNTESCCTEQQRNRSEEIDSSSESASVQQLQLDSSLSEDTHFRSKPQIVKHKGLVYTGPTKGNRPNYKLKQEWEWNIYPHGVSKQNHKLRVQIKQKGANPTYPSFPCTLSGLLDAALFRDQESFKLWKSGVLARTPKFNFEAYSTATADNDVAQYNARSKNAGARASHRRFKKVNKRRTNYKSNNIRKSLRTSSSRSPKDSTKLLDAQSAKGQDDVLCKSRRRRCQTRKLK
eukprot:jgi/Bigna1/80966/fgenesh1_pg.76_\